MKKQYHLQNKEKINERSKTWCQEHKEQIKLQKKEYREKNKEELLKKKETTTIRTKRNQ